MLDQLPRAVALAPLHDAGLHLAVLHPGGNPLDISTLSTYLHYLHIYTIYISRYLQYLHTSYPRAGDHRLVLRRDRDHHLAEGADHAAAQGHPVPAAQRSVAGLLSESLNGVT